MHFGFKNKRQESVFRVGEDSIGIMTLFCFDVFIFWAAQQTKQTHAVANASVCVMKTGVT